MDATIPSPLLESSSSSLSIDAAGKLSRLPYFYLIKSRWIVPVGLLLTLSTWNAIRSVDFSQGVRLKANSLHKTAATTMTTTTTNESLTTTSTSPIVENSIPLQFLSETTLSVHTTSSLVPKRQNEPQDHKPFLQQKQQLPHIVWLLSFPNSGTTFTLKYVQGATGTTTATNYASTEQVGYTTTSIPVHNTTTTTTTNNSSNTLSVTTMTNQINNTNASSLSLGPFFRYPNRPIPPHSILTKTHCENHRMVDLTVDDFDLACRSGKYWKDGVVVAAAYPTTPRRAVHLVRHPVDNIVARMHYYNREHSSKTPPQKQQHQTHRRGTEKRPTVRRCTPLHNSTRLTRHDPSPNHISIERHRRSSSSTRTSVTTTTTQDDNDIDNDRYEFARYCNSIRQTTLARGYHRSIEPQFWQTYMSHLPCAMEFYRYFAWHSLATAMRRKNDFSTLILYYEDYTTQFNETVDRLLTFLHFDRNNSTAVVPPNRSHTNDESLRIDPPVFSPGKTYPNVLSAAQLAAVQRLGRAIVSDNATWALIRHYFS